MNIEFMFDSLNNIEFLYSHKEIYNADWGDNIPHSEYLGTKYCENIVLQLKSSYAEIKDCIYKGQPTRNAREEYKIVTDGNTYMLTFTIDTFEDKALTQILVNISSASASKEYDVFLEKSKIFLKTLLIRDWKMCTWINDEQSENLGMNLYPLIFRTENKMRAFVNRVMTLKFGTEWMGFLGLEDIILGHQRSNVAFKREVPEFANINDFLICSTSESLANLIFKSKIYETAITFSNTDSLKFHEMIRDNRQPAVIESLRKLRRVKVDIWKDVFVNYFPTNLERVVTDFIKNRNHVAHNKLLTLTAFEKMKNNIKELEQIFDKANIKFNDELPSKELLEDWYMEQEEERITERCLYDKINNDSGIQVLRENEIFSLFEDKITELYTDISDREYFNPSIQISSLNNIQNDNTKQILFSIISNVENSFDFEVCAEFDVTEGMGENSHLMIWVEKSDSSIILQTTATYRNGEAHFNEWEGYYLPDSEAYFDDDIIQKFLIDLTHYINEDMNTIKVRAKTLALLAENSEKKKPLAEFACFNCNQNFVSLENEIYPYGHCVNCGEENEIAKCILCGAEYSAFDGSEDLCNQCLEIINK